MAKKRKAGSGRHRAGALASSTASGIAGAGDDDRRYKMNVQSYMDVANSEDEWDHERDKLLLEGGGAGGLGGGLEDGDDEEAGRARKRRRRRLQEREEQLDESADEILSVDSEFDEEGSYGVGDEDEDEEDDEEGAGSEEDLEDDSFGARAKSSKGGKDAVEDDDDDEDDEANDSSRRRYPEDEEGWGDGDAYGADVAENEEDAREIEAEALRLQKKRLEGLTDADFGFDEAEWLGEGEGEDGDKDASTEIQSGGKVTELLPLTEITEDTPAEERLRILKVRYPEFELLAAEFNELQKSAQSLEPIAERAQRRRLKLLNARDEEEQEEDRIPTASLKYSALSAYMAALSMYFALLTSPVSESNGSATAYPMDPKELRDHNVMNVLMRQRTLWEKVKNLSLEEDEGIMSDDRVTPEPAEASEISIYYTPMEESFGNRLPEAMKEAKKAKAKAKRVSKAEQAALEARVVAQAQREAHLKQLDEEMAKASKLIVRAKKSPADAEPKQGQQRAARNKNAASNDDSDSDFADDTTLSAARAEEKERRKKSLRFYTSQIAQKANRRAAASLDAGGDNDLPYKERVKDRIARLNAEAEARGANGKSKKDGTELDDAPSDDDDRAVASALRSAAADDLGSDGEDGEDYYQTIALKKASKKTQKDARKAALKEAAAFGGRLIEHQQDNPVGADGKRAIGYTIEKNKGLTQNRRKEIRNPRVKKRLRFEDKKKKLASMRPVFKAGGEGRGGYGGELTGIKTGVSRGVKL